jgi:hypothetical protein
MTLEENHTTMLEMEEKLAMDEGGEYKASLLASLQELITDVKRHMDKGLAPDAFKRAEKIKACAEAAFGVVEKA